MKPTLVAALPDDESAWIYEIKFDGFRVIALKTGPKVQLWSASQKPLNFPVIERALAGLCCENAVIDGEVVALDEAGRSSFQLLQNSRDESADAMLCFYAFDLLQLEDRDLKKESTLSRKAVLADLLAQSEGDHRIRLSANLGGAPARILEAARELGLEGIVAKRADAAYAPGTRSPAWQKCKLLSEQEFVIGGYTAPEGSRKHFGSVIIGYYSKGKLMFAAKAGSGFTDSALQRYHRLFQGLRRKTCPFANLPAKTAGRWGQGLTTAKMRSCVWLEPELVCQVRFAEWTLDGGLRQPIFLGMRDDKRPRTVVREDSTKRNGSSP